VLFQVRFHGRGGHGVVTAAEMLSVAAFVEGRHAQALPSFGSERAGAPVVAFCRISDTEIRTHSPIAAPDAVVVQDASAPGQPFRQLRRRRLSLHQHDSQSRRAGPRQARRRDAPGPPGDRPRHTARVGAPRPACAECRASRRLGSAERRGVSRRRRGRDQPRRRRFATGGPVSSCRTPSTTPTCRGPSAPVSRSRAAPRPSTRSCRVAKRAGTGLQKCRHGSRHRRRVKRQHCLYFRPLPHGHESLRPVVRHRNRSSCSAVSSSALISKIGRPWRARAAIRLR